MDIKKPAAIKNSLFKKGLLLLLAPAMVQLFGFWEISQLVSQSEKLEAMSATDSKITALVDRIQSSVAEGFAIMLAEGTFGSRRHLVDPQELRAKLDKQFAELQKLIEGDRLNIETYDEMHRFAYSQFDMTDKLAAVPKEGYTDGLPARLHAMKVNIRRMAKAKKAVEAKRDEQRDAFEQRRIWHQQELKELKIRIAIELSITFVATFALMLLLLRNITKRLSTMVTNTQSLADKSIPFQKIKGADEIAYLNNVLEQTKSELIAANEQRASLIQTVSHDIRSPLLSARLAVTKLAGACSKQAPSLIPQTVSIGNLVDKILRFAEDLLSIERMDQVEMELDISVIEIDELISEVVTTLNGIIEAKEIRVVQEIQPLSLVVDKMRIDQVISNLLSNAVKFSPLRGEIKIVGRNIGKQYAVRITDQGPGVAANDQNKIFDKFYMGANKSLQGGFGIGLTICKEIVRRHGGEIGVVSKPNEATTFWFTMPLDEEDAAEVMEASSSRLRPADYIDGLRK